MKRLGISLILGIVIVILIGGIAFLAIRKGGFLSNQTIKDGGSGVSDYSAVFLTNGQVYFGKLNKVTDQQIDISDIYYLQVNQQVQPTQAPTDQTKTPDIVLMKLGKELHGPNDLMHINRSQVLFYESMKDDSKVVKSINDNKSQK